MLAVQQRSRELLTNLVKSRMHPGSTFETAQTAGPCPASDQRVDRPFFESNGNTPGLRKPRNTRREDLVLVRSFRDVVHIGMEELGSPRVDVRQSQYNLFPFVVQSDCVSTHVASFFVAGVHKNCDAAFNEVWLTQPRDQYLPSRNRPRLRQPAR